MKESGPRPPTVSRSLLSSRKLQLVLHLAPRCWLMPAAWPGTCTSTTIFSTTAGICILLHCYRCRWYGRWCGGASSLKRNASAMTLTLSAASSLYGPAFLFALSGSCRWPGEEQGELCRRRASYVHACHQPTTHLFFLKIYYSSQFFHLYNSSLLQNTLRI